MKCASILPLAIVLATTCAIGQDTVTRANSDNTYSDGSTWHAPSPGASSVPPDGFMLVSDTR
jgi:hypothetical protein